jgi:hypothetical protein
VMNGMLIFLQVASLEFALQVNDGQGASKRSRDLGGFARGPASRTADIQ